MFKAILLAFLLLPVLAAAEPVALRFDRLPLVEAARLIYGSIDKESYILSPEFDQAENSVTLDLVTDNPGQAKKLFERYLRQTGYVVEREAGVVFLRKAEKAPEPSFHRTYFPKYQSADSLRRLIDAAIPRKTTPGNGIQSDTTAASTSILGQAQSTADVLVFTGTQSEVTLFDSLVAALDVKQKQVHVTAAVVEVSKASSKQSALQLLADFFNGNLKVDIAPAPLPFSFSLGVGGLSAALTLLDTDSRFSLISSPSVLVQSGETAMVSIGSEVPVLGSTTVTNGGNQTQAIEYRSAGVLFEVVPTVRQSGVYVKISQTLSDFVRTSTGVNNSPTLLKREVKSNIQVKDEEVFVFAGLNERQKTDTKSAFSLLPITSSESESDSKREIVVLLQVRQL